MLYPEDGTTMPAVDETAQAPIEDVNNALPFEAPPQVDALQFSENPNETSLPSTKVSNARAEKYSFALGLEGADKATLASKIASGEESFLRHQVASQKETELRAKAMLELSRSPEQYDSTRLLELAANASASVAPWNVIENIYADKATNYVTENFINPVLNVGANPAEVEKQMKATRTVIGIREQIARIKEDLQDKYEKQGVASTVADFIGPMFYPPAFDVYRFRNRVGGEKIESFLTPGENIAQQVQWLFTHKNPDVAMNQLRAEIKKLEGQNLQQALSYVSKFLEYSGSDAAIDSAFGLLEAATAPGVGTLFKATRRAAIAAGPTSHITAAAAGNTQKAMELHLRAAVTGGDGALDDVMSSIPAIVDPQQLRNGKAVYSPEIQQRLVDELKYGGVEIQALVNKVVGLTESIGDTTARTVAVREALENMSRQYNLSADRVVKTNFKTVDETLGADYVSASLGDAKGLPFTSKKLAQEAAERELNLAKGSYTIEEAVPGSGTYYVEVNKAIDTRSVKVLDQIKIEQLEDPSRGRGIFGTFSSPDYYFDKSLQSIAKSGYVALSKSRSEFAELVQPLKDINKASRSALNETITYQMRKRDPITKKLGVHSTNFGEFSEDFYRVNNRTPTEKETLAYFRAVQIHNMDYLLRNLTLKNAKEALGLEMHVLRTNPDATTGLKGVPAVYEPDQMKLVARNDNMKKKKTAELGSPAKNELDIKADNDVNIDVELEGKFTNELPWNAPITERDFYGVLTWTGNFGDLPASSKSVINRRSKKEAREAAEALIADGYKLVQLSSEGSRALREMYKKSFGKPLRGDVTHVLVPGNMYQAKPLPFKQLPFQPGFHRQVPDEGFIISQPIIDPANKNKPYHRYDGDLNVHYVADEASAKDYTNRLESARKMLIDVENMRASASPNTASAEAALDAFIKGNLPYSRGLPELEAMFKRGALDINQPIRYRPVGSRTIDATDIKPNDGYELLDGRTNYFDLYRSNVDLSFTQLRDEPLSAVSNVGGPGNPLYSIVPTPQMSFYELADRAMGRLLNGAGLDGYKRRVVTEWLAEFDGLLPDAYRNNQLDPFEAFLNFKPTDEQLKAQKELVSRALFQRRLALEAVGLKSEFHKRVETAWAGAIDKILADRNLPGKAGDYVKELHELRDIDKPVTFFRSLGFNVQMSMYNPVQWFVNMGTFVHMNSIAPLHAMPSTFAAFMGLALRWNSKPQMVEHGAKIMRAFGWDAADFKRAWQAAEDIGWRHVGREHSSLGDFLTKTVMTSKGEEMLDASAVFFTTSERMLREASWFTAWSEFRKANPAILNPSKAQLRSILERADVLSVNMTQASNATWQKGITGVPTQFLSYQARLAEQLWQGGAKAALTPAEKMRLVAGYSLAFGIPAGGVGAAAGILYPWHEMLEQKLMENGMTPDNSIIAATLKFSLLSQLSTLSGREWDVTRFAPGGISLFKDLLYGNAEEKVQAIAGPGPNLAHQILKQASGPARWLLDSVPVLGTNSEFKFTTQDAHDLLRTTGTGRNIITVWNAFANGEIRTRDGMRITDVTSDEGVVAGFMGMMPKDVSRFYLMLNSEKARREHVTAATKEYTKWFELGIKATNEKDQKAYFERMYKVMAGLPPDIQLQVFQQFARQKRTPIENLQFRFNTRTPDRINATEGNE